MKKLYPSLFLLVVLLTGALNSHAQNYMAAVNRSMSQMNMNMNMQRMMNMSMFRSYNYMTNQKYKFSVLLKDSTVREIKSKIYMDTTLHKSYLTYDDKTIEGSKKEREKRIYSTETLNISRKENGSVFTGMATDSCWLFKVVAGKINAYSPLSETYDIDSFYLRAYQLGNGPIQKIDSASLAPILAKSPKALKAFKKKDYYKAIDKYNSDKEVAN